MISSPVTRLRVAMAVGLWLMLAASNSFAHGEHDTVANRGEASGDQATFAARSEQFVLDGKLEGSRLILKLSRPDGSAVKDARLEISIDGETTVAAPQPMAATLSRRPRWPSPAIVRSWHR